MSTPTELADRMQKMIADPDLTGDLLTIGLTLAVMIDHSGPPWPTVNTIGQEIFGHECGASIIRRAIREDARTFRTPMPRTWTCNRPMIRRAGECGKHATNRAVLTDWATGIRQVIQACNRHRDWWEHTSRTNYAQKPVIGTIPLPPANSGGVLARHFPDIDWPRLWTALDKRWTPHPEPGAEPGPGAAAPGPPTLTLHLGEGRSTTRQRLFGLSVVPEPGSPPRLT